MAKMKGIFCVGIKTLYEDLIQTWNSVPYNIIASKNDCGFSKPQTHTEKASLASCDQLPLKCNIAAHKHILLRFYGSPNIYDSKRTVDTTEDLPK